jgi:subfamily B ATP-binding cassette protein MsbA
VSGAAGRVAQRVALTFRLAQPPRAVSVAIVLCGLAAAALEAFGLSLFMPLVQSLGGGRVSGGFSSALFGPFLAGWTRSEQLLGLVAALITCMAGKNLVSFAGGYLARHVDGLVAHRLRVKVLAQTLSSCVDYRPGARITDVVTTLTNNTWKVSEALSLCWRLVICSCTAVVFLGLLAAISARLTLVAVIAVAIIAWLVHLATARAESLGKAVVEENKRFGLRMWESTGALQLIRAFGREAYELDRFGEVSERVRRRILRLDLLWSMPGPIAEVMAALLIGLLIVGGQGLGVGLASLAAFLAVLYRLQGPVREFLSCKVALEGLGPALADVAVFLAETREPLLRNGAEPAPELVQGLEFREVSFRYAEGEPPALDRVSLTLPAGKTTAIVGRSGAGKSTLMSLLLRFRDPVEGEVLADGRPLPALDIASWRARLSLMPQEPQLFNAPVAENIAYGDLSADAARIREAAEVAGAAAFIERLPQGYGTELGDRGARLSGGQRQRIALARTILKNPRLLLLDEPTNALDPETERTFQAALERFSAGRTVVVIAHRLSTVMNADQVIVLEDGRVAEVGPPSELVARPGRFARLHGLNAGPLQEIA